MKSWISGLIATALLFGVSSTSFAAESYAKVELQSKITSKTKSLYTSEGGLLGTVVRDTTVTISKQGKDVLFSVTEKNDYELVPKFKAIPKYQTKFADGTKTNNFRISDNKLYLNGKLVD
ncbi:hypothetical protein [Paenibacillus sanguinis]|uniref:hypothetical protein n=1 Tax=Paenibacillus sanguinis TaxID=225906 RepID=UPI0012B5B267|nr:hypothetical protein [Paenibacillus sanguinis]